MGEHQGGISEQPCRIETVLTCETVRRTAGDSGRWNRWKDNVSAYPVRTGTEPDSGADEQDTKQVYRNLYGLFWR